MTDLILALIMTGIYIAHWYRMFFVGDIEQHVYHLRGLLVSIIAIMLLLMMDSYSKWSLNISFFTTGYHGYMYFKTRPKPPRKKREEERKLTMIQRMRLGLSGAK